MRSRTTAVLAGLVLAAVARPSLTIVEPGLGEIVERVLAGGAAGSVTSSPPRVPVSSEEGCGAVLPGAADPAGCAR